MNNFIKGFFIGALVVLVVFGVIGSLKYLNRRDKELIEYAEKQIEIEEMRNDVVNREPAEFVDTVPGVRGAVDGAAAEFERKRDEAVQRFRSRNADK